MGRKKQFIKKGEGVKFYLVHRSQKDPLFLDENLGEHVLVPADPNACDDDFIKSVNGMSLNASEKSSAEREELRRKRIEEQHKFGIFYSDDYDYLQHLKEIDGEEKASMEKLKETKVGSVLIKNKFDDETEHDEQFDDVDANNNIEKSRLQLPSTVFASKFEEEIGYMNQAAPDHDPKINWDPDIVKILDESSDVEYDNEENEFEDDFFIKANSEEPTSSKSAAKKNKVKSFISEMEEDDEEEEEEDEDDDEEEEEEENDSTVGFNDYYESESVRDFETKSRFSNYSMSSSVMRRNEGLRQLDDHFEKVFAEYDEDQIGSLETDEIDGFRHSDDLTLKAALEEFQKLTEKKTLDSDSTSTKNKKAINNNVNKKTKSKLGVLVEESEEAEEDENIQDNRAEDDEEESSLEETTSDEDDQKEPDYELVRFTQKRAQDDRFDCESIVSTYSNLYNRPAIINERDDNKIKLSKKSGLPLGVLPEKPMSKNQMDKIEHKITRILPEIPQRKENETKEEKKLRKQAVKEHRRERRVEKKINKMAFKSEQVKQMAQMTSHAELSHSIKILL